MGLKWCLLIFFFLFFLYHISRALCAIQRVVFFFYATACLIACLGT